MPTAAIQRRVIELSGTKIPTFSTYQALRTLTKRGRLKVTHRGRENIYWPAGATPKVPARRGRPPKSAAAPPAPRIAAPVPRVAAAQTTEIQVVHTLAPGEVAILHVGETHVEAATNEHGKLVISHHPRRAVSTAA